MRIFPKIVFRLFFSIPLFWGGCKDSVQPWEAMGERTTESRILSTFDRISVSQSIELYITQDTNAPISMIVDYGKNAIKGILTQVNYNQHPNGELIVKDNNKAKWLRNLEIIPRCTLNLHQLSKLNIEGNARVICLDTLRSNAIHCTVNSVENQILNVFCGQFYGGITNSGSILFKGQATIFSWSCEKGGGIDARDLRSDDVYLRHFTVRDVFVNPSKQFEAYLYNSGNAYYREIPSYKFKINQVGSGKVLKINP